MNGLKYRTAARMLKQSAESEAVNVKSLDATPMPPFPNHDGAPAEFPERSLMEFIARGVSALRR
jgi:hypothetical protein